jgi:hypothetical protein
MIRSGMMPPTGSLAPADVQLFSDWLRAGAPRGECSAGVDLTDAGTGPSEAGLMMSDAGVVGVPVDATAPRDAQSADAKTDDPYAAPSRCSSDKHWTAG